MEFNYRDCLFDKQFVSLLTSREPGTGQSNEFLFPPLETKSVPVRLTESEAITHLCPEYPHEGSVLI